MIKEFKNLLKNKEELNVLFFVFNYITNNNIK